MCAAIIGVIGTLLGTVLGALLTWRLNEASERKRNEPKLVFRLQTSNEEPPTEKELRTKTSPSGYILEIYNIGQVPFMWSDIHLSFDNNSVVDLPSAESNCTIMPYQYSIYELDEQEYDNICFHSKELDVKRCDVIAFGMDNKIVFGELDLTLPRLQSDFR